jgi:hypothetical protein
MHVSMNNEIKRNNKRKKEEKESEKSMKRV